MKKAILYLCKEDNEKHSLQKQYDYAELYCEENGFDIIRVFDETSSKPPFERYYFDKALRVAQTLGGEDFLKYFLVMDYSCITKSFSEFEEIRKELESNGVYIYPIFPIGQISDKEFFDILNQEK